MGSQRPMEFMFAMSSHSDYDAQGWGLMADTTPPQPYKPLGFLMEPLPTIKKPFVSLRRVGAK
jgi:hypothetical protein